MKTLSILVLVAHLFSLGCSHVYTVSATNPRQMEGPNRLCLGRITRVVLKDSQAFGARDLFMTPDSTSWLDMMTGQALTVETPRVAYIRGFRHGQGAAEGLLTGVLVGGVPGALIGFAGGDDPPGFLRMTASEKALCGAIILGGLGAIIGLIAGASQGSDITYRVVQ